MGREEGREESLETRRAKGRQKGQVTKMAGLYREGCMREWLPSPWGLGVWNMRQASFLSAHEALLRAAEVAFRLLIVAFAGVREQTRP